MKILQPLDPFTKGEYVKAGKFDVEDPIFVTWAYENMSEEWLLEAYPSLEKLISARQGVRSYPIEGQVEPEVTAFPVDVNEQEYDNPTQPQSQKGLAPWPQHPGQIVQ